VTARSGASSPSRAPASGFLDRRRRDAESFELVCGRRPRVAKEREQEVLDPEVRVAKEKRLAERLLEGRAGARPDRTRLTGADAGGLALGERVLHLLAQSRGGDPKRRDRPPAAQPPSAAQSPAASALSTGCFAGSRSTPGFAPTSRPSSRTRLERSGGQFMLELGIANPNRDVSVEEPPNAQPYPGD
jgi:hypothetical protein